MISNRRSGKGTISDKVKVVTTVLEVVVIAAVAVGIAVTVTIQ